MLPLSRYFYTCLLKIHSTIFISLDDYISKYKFRFKKKERFKYFIEKWYAYAANFFTETRSYALNETLA